MRTVEETVSEASAPVKGGSCAARIRLGSDASSAQGEGAGEEVDVGLLVPLPCTELLDEGLGEALRLAAVIDGEALRVALGVLDVEVADVGEGEAVGDAEAQSGEGIGTVAPDVPEPAVKAARVEPSLQRNGPICFVSETRG